MTSPSSTLVAQPSWAALDAVQYDNSHLTTIWFNYINTPQPSNQDTDHFAAEETEVRNIAADFFRRLAIEPIFTAQIPAPQFRPRAPGWPDGLLFFALPDMDTAQRPVTYQRVLSKVLDGIPWATGISVWPPTTRMSPE
jgi:hypothetical protein